MIRASRLHPRTPHWCSATVGASQVSGRQSGRPSSPPSRRDWCQRRALPGRLPSSPARHLVEPVLGVRGQALWGESVCPMLPWRQLFQEAHGGVAGGGQLARAGDEASTGCICLSATTVPTGGSRRAQASLRRCPLEGYCLADPRCLGLNRTFSRRCRAPRHPQLGPAPTEGLEDPPGSLKSLRLAPQPPVFNVLRNAGSSREEPGR